MQVTIEIPDDLAGRLEGEREHLAEIIERGLRRNWSEATTLAREVVSFLAREPRPDEILAFQPSERFVEHTRELLDKNRDGTLTPDEEAEMDEIEALDNFMAVLKARARRLVKTSS
ncbi:MAG: hypothetical protein HY298_11560 [Verrucomicrobia bacterium]|nr:hypothetical protein [Verrucomicrobiota bacterium]